MRVHHCYYSILRPLENLCCLVCLMTYIQHWFGTEHTSESSSTPVSWQAISGQVMGAPPPSMMASWTYCCKHWRGSTAALICVFVLYTNTLQMACPCKKSNNSTYRYYKHTHNHQHRDWNIIKNVQNITSMYGKLCKMQTNKLLCK